MRSLFFWLALLVGASATDVPLIWDANPAVDAVTEYRMYERTSVQPEAWTKVGTSTQPALTLQNVSAAAHTYAVTATNANGESDRSNTVTVPATQPSAPMNLRLLSSLTPLSPPPFVPPAGGGSFAPTDIAGLHRYETTNYNATTGALTDSGNLTAANLTQAISGSRPSKTTAALNGLDVMTFDGVDDYLDFPGGAVALGDFTAFAVVSRANGGYHTTLLGDTSATYLGVYQDANAYLVTDSSTFASVASNFTGWAILAFNRSGAAVVRTLNGTSASMTGSASGTVTPSRVGWRTGSEFIQGNIAELLIYNSALSPTDFGHVQTYLQTKYGL